MTQFSKDLETGKRGEQMLAAALAARGHTVIDQSDNPVYQQIDVDFTLFRNGQETTLEVKNDLRSEDTGNVFMKKFFLPHLSKLHTGQSYKQLLPQ